MMLPTVPFLTHHFNPPGSISMRVFLSLTRHQANDKFSVLLSVFTCFTYTIFQKLDASLFH